MSKVASETNLVASQGQKQLSNADKLSFNKALREAKIKEQEGKFAEALKCYQQADAIYSAHDKLKKKIKHLLQKTKEEEEEDNKENVKINLQSSAIKPKTPAKIKEEVKKPIKRIIEDSDEEEESEEETQKVDPAKDSYEKLDEDFYLNTRTRECIVDYQQPKRFILPEKVYRELLPHQKEGIAWLWKLFKNRKGGILGDDMGLGKSVQLSSFLGALFKQKQIERCLVIAPTSLIEEPWEKELNKWAPGVNIKKFHGSSVVQRQKALDSVITRGGVALTTYGMVRENVDQVNQTTWDMIVLDEAHVIKKHTNKIYQTMVQLKAVRRILLTATPIMNNLTELWALINFISDGQLLGHITTFHTEFERPILAGNSRNANATQKQLSSALTQKLRNIIHPYFLRREKKDVFKQKEEPEPIPANVLQVSSDENKQLAQSSESVEALVDPLEKLMIRVKKNDYVVWIKLTPVQIKLYADFLTIPEIQEILNKTRSPLAALSVLRKISDHPQLLSTEVEYSSVFNLQTSLQQTTLIQQSAKLQFVVTLMKDLKKNSHRVLIFSQSTKMLDIIQQVLKQEGHKLIRIDGEIPLKERQQRITTFNTDRSYFCFLLSTKVGGFGLNLTSADRVIIFDPSWNTTDNQAVDRAYRIGQQKNVVVYRLITCSTIEEKIYRKQIFKDDLMRMITQKKQAQPRRLFSDEELKIELKQMFQFENPNASLTQQILEEYLNKFKRQNENRRQSLETHVATLRANPLVFGLSPHDLVLDADKLRNIWARRVSQFGTELNGSPSNNNNINAQSMLANRSRSNAPQSPSDPDLSAASAQVIEAADKSLQKLQKTILPLHVVEHQRQVDHETMSTQKSEVKRKRLQKLDEEDGDQRSPTRVRPTAAPSTGRKRIIDDESDEEEYERNGFLADEAEEADANEQSFERYISDDEAEQERTAVDLHSEAASEDQEGDHYEKDSFVASEDDEGEEEEDDGYASAADDAYASADDGEDYEQDEINRQIRNSVPRITSYDNEEEEVVDLTGPIDVNDVAQALRTMRIQDRADDARDEEDEEDYDQQYSEEEEDEQEDDIVDVDSPVSHAPARSERQRVHEVIEEAEVQEESAQDDVSQVADRAAVVEGESDDEEMHSARAESETADQVADLDETDREVVDMNEAFEDSDREQDEDKAEQSVDEDEDEEMHEESKLVQAAVHEEVCEEIREVKAAPVKVVEESTDDFGFDDFSLVNDLELTAEPVARKSLPKTVALVVESQTEKVIETEAETVSEAQDEHEIEAEVEAPVQDEPETVAEVESENDHEEVESSPERSFAPRKSVFGDAELGNFLLTQMNSAPRETDDSDSDDDASSAEDETFDDVPVYDYRQSILSAEAEEDDEVANEGEESVEDDEALDDNASADSDDVRREEELKALLERIDINSAAVTVDERPVDEAEIEAEDTAHPQLDEADEGDAVEDTTEVADREDKAAEDDASESESDTHEDNVPAADIVHNENARDAHSCDHSVHEHDAADSEAEASEDEEELLPKKKNAVRRVVDDEESDAGNFSFEGYITDEEENDLDTESPEEREVSPAKPIKPSKKSPRVETKMPKKFEKVAIEISDDEEQVWEKTPKIKKLVRKNSADDFQEPRSSKKEIVKSSVKPWETNRREFLLNKETIAKELFEEYNNRIFGGKLDKLDLVWSKALTNCAGKYCVVIENKKKYCCIKLSAKFLTTSDRLKSTLIHEMCHAATHLIDDEIDESHGPVWFKWTKIAEATYPGTKITQRHSYDIEHEFQQKNQYVCTNNACDSIFGTTYKLKKAEKVCSKCRRGALEILP